MSAPDTAPSREGMPLGLKLVLFVFLPIFLILVFVTSVFGLGALGGGVGWFGGFNATPVSSEQQVEAGSSVFVDIEDAELNFVESDDSQVHVTVDGSYSGKAPEITARTNNGVTEITGGCENRGFFNNCRLEVTVAMPADLPLDVKGVNGRVSIDEIEGPISVETTNGAIEVSGASGDLDLQTNNGAISVQDSSSMRIDVGTTNGRIELELVDAPTSVEAQTTNGSIEVQLPGDASYDVDADTVNGNVDTDGVSIDSDSERSLRLETTNGSITVEPRG